jgi:GGDEF domain-containing protein
VLAALSGPLQVGGQRLPIAASVGVCVIDSEHAAVSHYPAAVLRDADAALRVAKREGRAGSRSSTARCAPTPLNA